MFTQLTQEQRYQIHALLKMEHSRTEIADTLGVHDLRSAVNCSATVASVAIDPNKLINLLFSGVRKHAKGSQQTFGHWSRRNCARIGARNKSPDGSKKKVLRSVMNISTNTSMQTSVLVETYGSICAVRRNGGNVLVITTAGAKSPTERALRSVQK